MTDPYTAVATEEGLSSMDRDDPAYEGQREYTPLFLRFYDPVILGFLAPVVWRCPATRLVEGYRQHLGHRHLDVGPGTGYFLERAGIPDGSPVTLLDPNMNVLGHASRRLRNLNITTIESLLRMAARVDSDSVWDMFWGRAPVWRDFSRG